jgi:hypothetical protein
MADKRPLPTIVYIYSAGHSGSTLLASLIGRHQSAFNAGEIGYLSRRLKTNDGGPCTCGAPDILHCQFWRRVDEWLRNERGRGLKDLNIGLSKGATVDDVLLFSAIAAVADVSVIIDASKNSRRLQRLASNETLPVLPVILLADPRKIVFSMRGRLGYVKYALRLNRLGLRMRRVYRLGRKTGLAPIVVHYEELAEHPARTVEKITRRTGLAFSETMLDWAQGERHDVGGNQMRFGTESVIRKDRRWRSEMSMFQQAYILALSPIFWAASRSLLRRQRIQDETDAGAALEASAR